MKTRRMLLKRIVAFILVLVLAVMDVPQGTIDISADEEQGVGTEGENPLNDSTTVVYELSSGGFADEAGTVLARISGRDYYKKNPGRVAVGYFYNNSYSGPVIVSYENPDAVEYSTNYNGQSFKSIGSLEYRGITWYYGSTEYWMWGNSSSTNGPAVKLESHDYTEVIKELIDKSYIVFSGESEEMQTIDLSSELIKASQDNRLIWEELPDTENYYILRNGQKIACLDKDARQYTDTDTQASTSYTYSILASDSENRIIGKGETVSAQTLAALIVDSDYTLTSDEEYFSVTINRGTLNLNQKSLNVAKKFTVYNWGYLNINGGRLVVYGDFAADYYSTVYMQNPNDILTVVGNVNYASVYFNNLTNGVFEVGGNFTATAGFITYQNHRFVLNGSSEQIVNITGGKSEFAVLELENTSTEGVIFNQSFFASTFLDNNKRFCFGEDQGIVGYKLQNDMEISGDFILGAGTLDLDGHKLTVTGDFVHYGGTVFVNGGELNIGNDYISASRTKNANGEYSFSGGSGLLKMTDSEDRVFVGGNFINKSYLSHADNLTAGIIDVKGNVEIYNYNSQCFAASGSHKVIFSGSSDQRVWFERAGKSDYDSRFVNVEIAEEKTGSITFEAASYTVGVTGEFNDNDHRILGYIDLGANAKFTDDTYHGDIRISQGVTLNGTHKVQGNVILDSELVVTGILSIEGNIQAAGSYRYLRLNGANAELHVDGSIILDSWADSVSMSGGKLYIGGNLTLYSEGSFSNNSQVIFCGEEKQIVSVPDIIHFNTVVIDNPEGVCSAHMFAKDNLQVIQGSLSYGSLEGKTGWTLEADEKYEGDLLLFDGNLDLNGHTLEVTGDFVQYSGTVTVGEGRLIVDGDYRIQEKIENTDEATKSSEPYKYGRSSGSLIMQEETGCILVKKNFYMGSNADHSGLLKAGTLEVQGDFYVYNNNSKCFTASGSHKVIFSGSSDQRVWFERAGKSDYDSRFVNVEIAEEKTGNITFEASSGTVGVTGEFNDNGHWILGYIDLGANAKFTDDTYHGDIRISQGVTLNGTHKVQGNVILDSELVVTGILSIEGNIQAAGSYRYLRLNGANAELHVAGNITLDSWADSVSMSGGKLYITGNLTLYSEGSFSNNSQVIFCGKEKQTASVPDTIHFNTVVIDNPEGVCSAHMFAKDNLQVIQGSLSYGSLEGKTGWRLEEDEKYEGDLLLFDGNLDLNGHTLEVTGDLVQYSGTVTVGEGRLIVDGDYRIQEKIENTDEATKSSEPYKYGRSSGSLIMKEEAGSILVKKGFYMGSNADHSDLLKAGILEVQGDFYVYNNNSKCFAASGSHKVIFSGSSDQRVWFERAGKSDYDSRFANVEIAEEKTGNITFEASSGTVGVTGEFNDNDHQILGYIDLGPNAAFTDDTYHGDIKISQGVTLNGTHIVNGNIILDTDLTVTGRLYVSGDVSATASYRTLGLNGKDSLIHISGNLNMPHWADCISISAGTFEIDGNLTTESAGNYTNNSQIVFTGNGRQTVLVGQGAHFNKIVIQNTSDEGVHFTNVVTYDELIRSKNNVFFGSDNSVWGWMLTEDETVDSFILADGDLNLNGKTLTVKGDLVHTGGNIILNGGTLNIEGSYCKVAWDTENEKPSQNPSSGRLIMSSTEDKVIISGDWNINSLSSMGNDISAGTVELTGNINQYGSYPLQMTGDSVLELIGLTEQILTASQTLNIANLVNNNFDKVSFGNITITDSITDNGKKITGTVTVDNLTKIRNGECSSNVRVTGQSGFSGDLSIDGNLCIAGNVTLKTNRLQVGSLSIEGTLDMGKANINCIGNTVISSYGSLKMSESAAYLLVMGDFTFYSYYSHNGILADGILELYGNVSLNNSSFIATGNHQTILAKKLVNNRLYVQTINISNVNGKSFNKLILKKQDKYYQFTNNEAAEKYAVEVIRAAVDEEPPEKVTGLVASEVTASKIVLDFDASSDNVAVSAYLVYRNGVLVGQTSTTRYVDKNLESDSEYVYEICAFDNDGNYSEKSDEFRVTTLPDTEAPSAVSGLALATRTGASITLNWMPSTDDVAVSEYIIYRDGVVLADKLTSTSYKDTTAVLGKSYRYSVKAKDKSGNVSADGNFVETSLAMPEITYMAPDDQSEYGPGKVNFEIRFKNVGNSTGNTVKIEYFDGDEWHCISNGELQQKYYNPTTLYVSYTWDITDLTLSENNRVRYTLTDADGKADVKEITFKLDKNAPESPTDFKGKSLNGSVELTWKPSVSADCTGYTLYRKQEGEETYSKLCVLQGGLTATYTDNSVIENSTYSYQLEAFDKFNNLSERASVSVDTDIDNQAPVVKTVTPLAGNINGTADIVITAEDNREISRIILQIKKDGSNSWSALGEAEYVNDKAVYSFDSTGFEDGVYFVNVIAVDAGNNESTDEFTRRYTIDNTGIQKLNIYATEVRATSARLEWDDAVEADFGYFLVERKNGSTFEAVATVRDRLGYDVRDLKPGQSYTFRVVGYDQLGNRGVPSEAVTVTTIDDETAPVISAVGPAKSYYKDMIKLSVSAYDDYLLEKAVFSSSTDGENYTEVAAVTAGSQSANATFSYDYDISGLPEGKLYIKYEVYDKAGHKNALMSDDDEVIGYVYIDRTAPSKVTGLRVAEDDGYIMLEWDDAKQKDSDIRGFKILRADSKTGVYKVICAETNTVNYADNTVVRGSDYMYMVAAIDIAGNIGENSDAVAASVKKDSEKPIVSCIYPESGETLGSNPEIQAGVQDAVALKSIVFKYSTEENPDIWTEIGTVNTSERVLLAGITWNTEGLTDGKYNVMVYAVDKEDNISDILTTEYTLDVTAPAKPELKAETGHMSINLTVLSDEPEDFDHYEIYRRQSGNSEIMIASVTDPVYTDTEVETLTPYYYRAAAYDINGNVAWSDEVQASADAVDVINPVAVLSETITGIAGYDVKLDGSSSTDNVRIVSYEWIVDGKAAGSGSTCTYRFENAGTYEVKLTVSDAAGNTDTAAAKAIISEATDSGTMSIRVTDYSGCGLAGAYVYFSGNGQEVHYSVTDANGYVDLSGVAGYYNVAAYKTGYLPADINVNISQYDKLNYQIALKQDELIVGELTVRRLSLEEMKAEKVDFSNPQNYEKLAFNLSVTINKDTSTYDFIVGKNETYTAPNSSGGSFSATNASKAADLPVVVYVNTSQTVSWLKEMYEVQLGVLNQADSRYVVENSVARLNLPKGVSLAALTDRKQSVLVDMGSIAGQQKKYTSWIVRGDSNGTYRLTADFAGTLMPFNAPVSAHFVADTKMEVSGGEGLYIYVMPSKIYHVGRKYQIRYAIVNKSETREFDNITIQISDRDNSVSIDEDATEAGAIDCECSDGKTVTIKKLKPGAAAFFEYTTETEISGVQLDYPDNLIYYTLEKERVQVLEGMNLGVKVLLQTYPKPVPGPGASPTASGEIKTTYGNIEWNLTNRTLTVKGTGDYLNPNIMTMSEEAKSHAPESVFLPPWHAYAKDIRYVEIDVTGMTTAHNMFKDCEKLLSVTYNDEFAKTLTDTSGMFSGCEDLTDFDLTRFVPDKLTDVSYMFRGCSSLKKLDFTNVNLRKLKNAKYMLEGCDSLEEVKTNQVGIKIDLPVNENIDIWKKCEGSTENTTYVIDLSYNKCTYKKSMIMQYGDIYGNPRTFKYGTYDGKVAEYDYRIDFTDFFKSSQGYNDSLIDASIRTAMAAFDIAGATGTEAAKIKSKRDYCIDELMRNIGFSDIEGYYYEPRTNSIGFEIGNRKIVSDKGKESSLILVAVRGAGYKAEWGGNFNVGNTLSNGNHAGWDIASDTIIEALSTYIATTKLEKDIKVWVVGYSRAAATSNLVCAKLIDGAISSINNEHNVFGFCYECPRNTINSNAHNKKYDGIKNIINPIDIVPKVVMNNKDGWNFIRYGKTYVIPSAVSTSGYASQKQAMRYYYKKILTARADNSGNIDFKSERSLEEELKHNIAEQQWVDPVQLLKYKGLIGPQQEISYNNILDYFANLTVNPSVYVERYQESFVKLLADIYSGDYYNWSLWDSGVVADGLIQLVLSTADEDFRTGDLGSKIIISFLFNILKDKLEEKGIELITAEIPILGEAIAIFAEVKEIAENIQILYSLTKNGIGLLYFSRAHYPELCLAWMDALSEVPKAGYLEAMINCPVDISVYDPSGRLVGQITDDVPQYIEDGVSTYIDINGQKVIYLPGDQEYTIRMTATDDGQVSYTLKSVSEEYDNAVSVISYPTVDVVKGDVLTSTVSMDVPEIENGEADPGQQSGNDDFVTHSVYKNAKGREIAPTHVQSGDEITSFTVTAAADSTMGYAEGSGRFVYGEFCKVNALANEGYTFVSWKQNGRVVSSDAEYRFRVTADTELTAEFRKNDDGNGSGSGSGSGSGAGGGYSGGGFGGDFFIIDFGGNGETDKDKDPKTEDDKDNKDSVVVVVDTKTKSDKLNRRGTVINSNGFSYMITKKAAKTAGTVTLIGCAALKSGSKGKLVIPATIRRNGFTYKVTVIDDYAFEGNKSIKSVTIGSNVTKIGRSAFKGCSKLTKVTFGKNVTAIGISAFSGCVKLSDITVGKNVKSIGSYAFYGCKKLKNVVIKSALLTEKKIGKQAFKGIAAKAEIRVPKKQYKLYSSILKKKGIGKNTKIINGYAK